MLYLFFAVFCSMIISVLMRLSERSTQKSAAMLSMNYVMCSVLALLFSGASALGAKAEGSGLGIALGVINGVMYLASFMLLKWNISVNGVALPATFMKLGVIVPTIISVLFFGETPRITQALGIALTLAAILLMQGGEKKQNGKRKGSIAGLLLLLFGGGCADGMSKVYEEIGPAGMKNQFLLITFGVALVLCLIICLLRRETIGKQEMFWGLLVGIPNYFSSRFLLLALAQIPAVVAYPVFSVGTILFATLCGMLFFGEKLNDRKYAALAIILAALVLLNV